MRTHSGFACAEGLQDTRTSCNRALQVVRTIRQRLSGNRGAYQEQQRNFAPYAKTKKGSATSSYAARPKKCSSWSTRFVCLADKDCSQIPSSVSVKEILVEAGLGEKKVTIPDVDCTRNEFHTLLLKTFPKLVYRCRRV